MSRTTLLKAAGILLLVAGITAISTWYILARPPIWKLGILVVLLLIPGRIQGHFYRDFFTGRRLFDHDRFGEAIEPLTRFIATVQERPWLKRLLWLSWSTYSIDPEVMAGNNLGACHLNEGNLREAERWLSVAVEKDPQAPLVQFNLGLLWYARGDQKRAAEHLARSRELGFRDDRIDDFVQLGQSLLARVEGRLPE